MHIPAHDSMTGTLLLQPMRLLKLLGDEMYESAMVMVRDTATLARLKQANFTIVLRDACMHPQDPALRLLRPLACIAC